MEEFVKDFDGEFRCMSDAEKLYAEALAHLLDEDTKDYVEFLKEDEGGVLNAVAESDNSYSEE